jgi:AcrR family transcriptional regulator
VSDGLAVVLLSNTILHRMSIGPEQRLRGRRRDPAIDDRLLQVANRHLAARGLEALSLTAIAEEACTTRQALYRRWPNKASLVADAIRSAADEATSTDSNDPRRDLELELQDFQRAISRPGALSMAATMLQDSTDEESRACYRAHVITPRRQRILQILERARRLGLIDSNADLDAATAVPTGAWFARVLAGDTPGPDWAVRTAAGVWRSVGGET